MTIKEKISETIGYLILTVFVLGWIDIGFGPQYTWWNLISYFAN